MKKVFRKIQKGTTKMIERIKSLGEMETKQKCVVQRFEIIIPLHRECKLNCVKFSFVVSE